MGGKSGGDQVVGYRFYFDILMGICRGPIDELVEIKVGDLEAWPVPAGGSTDIASLYGMFSPGAGLPEGGYYATASTVTSTRGFSIGAVSLFGGDKGEGGIVGNATLMMGHNYQTVPDYVKRAIAGRNATNHQYTYSISGGIGVGTQGETVERIEDISDFRGVATLFYSGQVCSNNPYPKTWKIRARRALQGWDKRGCWYPSKAVIVLQAGQVYAMNPAHIIYECLTNPIWGRGLPREEIDENSFVYAANRLSYENFGLCLRWARDSDIDQFVQRVIDHIVATLYVDRGSGLVTIRLVRDDYDVNHLPIFDYNSGLLSVDVDETASFPSMTNEIVVKWHDPIHDTDRQVRAHNLASIQSIGAVVSELRDYTGIPDPDLASRVASRDLRTSSTSLKKFKLKMDRRAWKLQPGNVFKVHIPDRGIESMVLRVGTYDDGNALESAITIEAVQDIFFMPSTTYTADAPWTWEGPQSLVAPVIPIQKAYEASLLEMYAGLSILDRQSLADDEGGVIVVAARPTANTLSTELVTTMSPPRLAGTGSFAPIGVLAFAVSYYDTVLQLQAGTELNRVIVGAMALLGDELVRVDSLEVTSGQVTIARGCGDTLPETHGIGAVIYFHGGGGVTQTDLAYTTGEIVTVQILSRTISNVLAPSLAPSHTVEIQARHSRPYIPGNFRINGLPAFLFQDQYLPGDLVFTWSSRNRLLQADQLIEHGAASVVAETGTTYVMQIRDHIGDVLLREYTGITDLTWTYLASDAITYGDPVSLDFVFFSVRDGRRSWDEYRIHINSIPDSAIGGYGYGDVYGDNWGGPIPSDNTQYGDSYGDNWGG